MPEEVSGTFDPEVDLNDDAVGSRHDRFKTFAKAQLSGVPLKEVEVANSRTHFKEYPELFQNS